MNISTLLSIGFGGALGAILRYLTIELLDQQNTALPIGTLSVNVIGSFVLGAILFSPQLHTQLGENTLLFFTIGVLGAYTTLSAFCSETFDLLQKGKNQAALFNISLTILLPLIAIWLAYIVSTHLNGGKL